MLIIGNFVFKFYPNSRSLFWIMSIRAFLKPSCTFGAIVYRMAMPRLSLLCIDWLIKLFCCKGLNTLQHNQINCFTACNFN